MRFIPVFLILVATSVFAQAPSVPSHTQTKANSKAKMPDDPFGKIQSKDKISKSKSTANAKAKRPPDPLEKNRSKATMTKSMTKANSKAKMPPDPIEKNKM